VTGNNSPLMHAASSLVLHAVKRLAEIPPKIKLLPATITDSVRNMKTEILNETSVSLDLEETLRGCEVHMTHIPTPGDEAGLRRLGVNLTTDPNFSTSNLFMD